MKLLIPVDGSEAAIAGVHHALALHRAGVAVQAIVLHVQPRLHRHIARFSSKTARDALRTERSAAALAPAIDLLSKSNTPFAALTDLGGPAERIAAVAEREAIDEIVMGVGRHPQWLRWLNPSIALGVMARTDIPVTVLARGRVGALQRYGVPAGIVGLAAALWAVE
jgi:nucleotide-binding universal stress UspA family protein